MIGDVTTASLHAALTGLAQRQRVTADNIANVQTPGFLAVAVVPLVLAGEEGCLQIRAAGSGLGAPHAAGGGRLLTGRYGG